MTDHSRYHPLNESEILEDLALCIKKAAVLSNAEIDSNNHIYWHTREACAIIARRHGIKLQQLISFYTKYTQFMSDRTMKTWKLVFWTEVMHPELLVRDVHDA